MKACDLPKLPEGEPIPGHIPLYSVRVALWWISRFHASLAARWSVCLSTVFYFSGRWPYPYLASPCWISPAKAVCRADRHLEAPYELLRR